MRLRKGRLVPFVVAVLAIAVNVENHIAVELLTEFQCQPGGKIDLERMIAIHMKNRRFNHLGHIGRIRRTPGIRRHGRETNLVVHDQMHRSPGPIPLQLRQIQHFSHRSLPSKGRITMHQQRQHLTTLRHVAQRPLPRPSLALHHRIHRLQMTRVGRQINHDLMTRIHGPYRLVTKVIFNITITRH